MTISTFAKCMLLFLLLLIVASAASAADNPGQGGSLSVRFPAFSLNAGEKVAGITVRSSHGQIMSSCLPGRWRCEHQGNAIHCFCLHQSHAIALTSLLPELFVRNIPGSVNHLSIDATVDFLDSGGSAFSKEFKEGDLIIK